MTDGPMVERECDAVRLNRVINHPAVLPWVLHDGIAGPLDLSAAVADSRNVCLVDADGLVGLLFVQLEPGVYEVHTQALPDARGAYVLGIARAALDYMFVRTDCMEVLTKAPADNPAAASLARLVGGTLQFTLPGAWVRGGVAHAVEHYALRYPEWIKRAHHLPELGRWFHERLHDLRGVPADHADSDAHDRHVGAAVAMLRAGQVDKSIILYNRWARFAGFAGMRLVERVPLVLDIGDGLIEVEGDGFSVIALGELV